MTARQPITDVQKAIQNPGEFFDTPEDVTRSTQLSDSQKKKILDSWEVDQTNLLVAEEENMTSAAPPGKAAEKLRKISKAKTALSS